MEKSFQNREDKLLHALSVATGQLLVCESEKIRPSLSLWAADTFAKMSMPMMAAPPAEMKDEIDGKLPWIRKNISDLGDQLFQDLTGMEKTGANVNKLRNGIKRALKDARKLKEQTWE